MENIWLLHSDHSECDAEKKKKKKENVLAHYFVDKTLCEERVPPFNKGAIVNLITPQDLLHIRSFD